MTEKQNKIPVTVFSGFLGSGKTTIISHLIDALLAKKMKVVYIKNEIGTAGIDSEIVQRKHIETRELLNGCICCTLIGSLYHALIEISETVQPDRIIIEASGAADPSAIALLLSTHPTAYRDGVIGVIDVVNFTGYANLSETARRQTQFIDLLVFNKIESVDISKKQSVVGYVRELNDKTPIVEAPNGVVPEELIFGISTTELTKLLSHESFSDHTHHLQEEKIETLTFSFSGLTTSALAQKALALLPNNVIRVKGFIHTHDGYMVVNKVGDRIQLSLAVRTQIDKENIIVCIGFLLHEWAEDIKATVQQMYV